MLIPPTVVIPCFPLIPDSSIESRCRFARHTFSRIRVNPVIFLHGASVVVDVYSVALGCFTGSAIQILYLAPKPHNHINP